MDYPSDPGCTGANDNTEAPNPPPAPQCSDNLDNDGDGLLLRDGDKELDKLGDGEPDKDTDTEGDGDKDKDGEADIICPSKVHEAEVLLPTLI